MIAQRALSALGHRPFAFQRAVWMLAEGGRSGLLHADTGSGKTFAVWGGMLDWIFAGPAHASTRRRRGCESRKGLQALWITPMKALANDTALALRTFCEAAGLDWRVEIRTGDTPQTHKARQDRSPPEVLVTTPESLSLMLSRPLWLERLAEISGVVVDEWHELLGGKRGTQLQLCLAALRQLREERLPLPRPLLVWGLSATLGNLEEAALGLADATSPNPVVRLAVGRSDTFAALRASVGPLLASPSALVCLEARHGKQIQVDTLLPKEVDRFPYAGHLGLRMLPPVIEQIEATSSSLVFTNTRSQAELWYQSLLEARPDWAGLLALHHGSLDAEVRQWVEQALRSGQLKAVVATSSLDLGVDFSPVQRVFQVGSPKGVARLLQRAGRSGHSPGEVSRLTLVPTNSWEILESRAAQLAIQAGEVESRPPPEAPTDVLVQHIATRVLGQPRTREQIAQETRRAYSYRTCSEQQLDWSLDFLSRGGSSLSAYPEFHRLVEGPEGWTLPDRRQAARHRQSIGTIVSDASVQLAWLSGGRIGQVEEAFIGRLKPGDVFLFAGRSLELVRVKELTAYVRRADGRRGAVPRWNGGSMPLSTELSARLRRLLAQPDDSPEARALAPLLAAQAHRSARPADGEWLVERMHSREGEHLLLYPFEGRTVHLGLASLLSARLARRRPVTFSIAVNDYGMELLLPPGLRDAAEQLFSAESIAEALRPEGLLEDLLETLSLGGLPLKRFREIARVSGLLVTGHPGAPRSARQLAASSNLYYEVFREHDPENALLRQALQEALANELNLEALQAALVRLGRDQMVLRPLQRPSPLAFPLIVERLREQLSSEKLSDRLARMLAECEAAS